MAKQTIKRPQFDWSTFSNNIKYAETTTTSNPSNGSNTNLGSNGAQVSFTVASTAIALVIVSVGLRSSTDFEHKPLIYLDGSLNYTANYTAALSGGAGSRAVVRTASHPITLTAGTHTISAGVFTSSATSPEVDGGAANITVIVLGDVTA